MELQPGAYDALATRSVAYALAGSELVASVGAVDSGEAAEAITWQLEQALPAEAFMTYRAAVA